MSDPASLLHKVVKIHSLAARPELNNRLGTVTSFSTERNRYLVQLHPIVPNSQSIAIRAENLSSATLTDKVVGKVQDFKLLALQIYNDPHTRQEVQRLYILIDRSLPSKIHPEHLALGFLVLFFLILRYFGISRTIMMCSFISVTAIVVLPDVMATLNSGQNVTATSLFMSMARNFPTRWRNVVVQTTGWSTISLRMALAMYVFLLLATGNVLIMSRKRSIPRNESRRTSYRTQSPTHMKSPDVAWSLDDIYKMGFDDASQSLEYGTSLPKDWEDYVISSDFVTNSKNHVASYSSTSRSSADAQEESYENFHDDSFVHRRGEKASSKLSFTTIAAFYSVFRVFKDLGFRDGRFNFNLFVANVKNMEPWRLGLLALSCYKIISAFI